MPFYASILYILASHWNDGNVFLLETPSLLFGLLGIYYTIKYTKYTKIYIGIGVLAAFSFLCKQYGIGFLVLIMFLICFNNARLKQLNFFEYRIYITNCNLFSDLGVGHFQLL